MQQQNQMGQQQNQMFQANQVPPQAQTGGQMQQGIMNQPPTMVSTKDLQYITDMLSWNLNAAKKAHFFAQHCTIPEIKTTIENACKMHERHYNQILAHLNSQQTYM